MTGWLTWLRSLFQHVACVGLPLLLAATGAACAVAFGQEEPGVAPLPVTPAAEDIPSWILAMLSTGGVGLLIRSGGLPLRVTHSLEERDRDLLRDVRDLARDAMERR